MNKNQCWTEKRVVAEKRKKSHRRRRSLKSGATCFGFGCDLFWVRPVLGPDTVVFSEGGC
jgi:hypothetical protein